MARQQYDQIRDSALLTERYHEAETFIFDTLHDKRMIKWIQKHTSSPYQHTKGTTCSDTFVEEVALELCGDEPTYANYRRAVGLAIHNYVENGPDEM